MAWLEQKTRRYHASNTNAVEAVEAEERCRQQRKHARHSKQHTMAEIGAHLTLRTASSFLACFANVACIVPLEASRAALASLNSPDSEANSRPEAAHWRHRVGVTKTIKETPKPDSTSPAR